MATSKVFEELRGINLIELLEHDQRPTLVLDLKDPLHKDYERSRIVFCNTALRSYPAVFTSIYQGGNENWQSPEFKEWAFGFPNHDYLINGNLPTMFYHGLLWTCSTLKRRWRIISGSRNTGPNLPLTDLNQMPYDTPPKIVQSENLNESYGLKGNRRYPRWTDVLPVRPHMQLFNDTDWSATALGPLDQWPDLLRRVTRFLISDSRFATVFWGPQMVTLYNEAFIEVATRKHPSIMGTTVEQAWGEIAEYLKGSFATAEKDGQATNMVNSPLYLERHGYLEETFFSYTIIPVRDEDGITRGFYATGFDTTREVIWQRRLSTLISVSATPDIDLYWHEVLKGFESNELDIPLAAIYSLQRNVDIQSLAPATTVQFQGGLGVAEGHPLAVKRSGLRQGSELVMPLFQKVMAIGGPLVLLVEDGSLPKGLLPGLNWRGFGPSTTVVILPLTAAEETLDFLLISLNPRRPYDEDYQGFIQLLHRQLSTSLTSALLVDRAKRKQAELVNELAASESRFKAMTELNTTGYALSKVILGPK